MDTSKYIVRRATEQDLLSIQRLNQKLFEKEYDDYDASLKVSWPYGDGEKYFREVIVNGYVAVALYDGEIIGYLAGSFEKHSYRNGKFAELDNMFVDSEHRNNGVGTMLIGCFVRYCHEHDINGVSVTAYSRNHDAIEFYRRNGFTDFELTLKKDFKKS